jgi:hypothetical protein
MLGLVSLTSAAEYELGEIRTGNGFALAPHYDLDIIVKKADFSCPAQQVVVTACRDDDLCSGSGYSVGDIFAGICPTGFSCEPHYGNVIFMPEDRHGQIYVRSSNAERAETMPELRVIDPCSGFFGDTNGAVVEIPRNDAGYRVYVRASPQPRGHASLGFSIKSRFVQVPTLISVQDERGIDLVYLGSFTSAGFDSSDGRIYRKKGNSRTFSITPLFMWSGIACCIDSSTSGDHPCGADTDGDGTVDISSDYLATGSCPEGFLEITPLCGSDNNRDGNSDHFEEALSDDLNGWRCPDGYTFYEDAVYCWRYDDPTWLFNIETFAEYLWQMDNQGVKILRIRFYPR